MPENTASPTRSPCRWSSSDWIRSGRCSEARGRHVGRVHVARKVEGEEDFARLAEDRLFDPAPLRPGECDHRENEPRRQPPASLMTRREARGVRREVERVQAGLGAKDFRMLVAARRPPAKELPRQQRGGHEEQPEGRGASRRSWGKIPNAKSQITKQISKPGRSSKRSVAFGNITIGIFLAFEHWRLGFCHLKRSPVSGAIARAMLPQAAASPRVRRTTGRIRS